MKFYVQYQKIKHRSKSDYINSHRSQVTALARYKNLLRSSCEALQIAICASGAQTRRLGPRRRHSSSAFSSVRSAFFFRRAKPQPIMPPSWMLRALSRAAAANSQNVSCKFSTSTSPYLHDPSNHLDLWDDPEISGSNSNELSRIQAIKISTSKTANAYTGLLNPDETATGGMISLHNHNLTLQCSTTNRYAL